MKDKKKLLYFFSVFACCLMVLFNIMGLGEDKVETISYDIFLDQVYDMNVDTVEYSETEGYIYFTLEKELPEAEAAEEGEDIIYKTVIMDDPELVNKLYESGAEFGSVAPVVVPWYLALCAAARCMLP